jgi:hypothetical protein
MDSLRPIGWESGRKISKTSDGTRPEDRSGYMGESCAIFNAGLFATKFLNIDAHFRAISHDRPDCRAVTVCGMSRWRAD